MSFRKIIPLTQFHGRKPFEQIRVLSTSGTCNLIQKWREHRGLPMNPNAHGILTDKPDYTFLDGRPTPYGSRQKQRIIKQREIAMQILTLTKEVDFAVERHNKLQQEEKECRESIVNSKLKPKGVLLAKT